MAPAALGLSGDAVHEPVHARGGASHYLATLRNLTEGAVSDPMSGPAIISPRFLETATTQFGLCFATCGYAGLIRATADWWSMTTLRCSPQHEPSSPTSLSWPPPVAARLAERDPNQAVHRGWSHDAIRDRRQLSIDARRVSRRRIHESGVSGSRIPRLHDPTRAHTARLVPGSGVRSSPCRVLAEPAADVEDDQDGRSPWCQWAGRGLR
jgi:hypothetical protein